MPRTEMEIITDMLATTSFDVRMTTLVTSVVRDKRDAIDGALYMVNAASAISSCALSPCEKIKLMHKLRDVSDEIEHQVMSAIVS